jgi:hypothetical protein
VHDYIVRLSFPHLVVNLVEALLVGGNLEKSTQTHTNNKRALILQLRAEVAGCGHSERLAVAM